jgi:hypothetical protein
MNWMSAFLGREHGRSAVTQASGNAGGMLLSVAGMRPSKTGTDNGRRPARLNRWGEAEAPVPEFATPSRDKRGLTPVAFHLSRDAASESK